jgi:hypothetical protein
MQPLQADYFTAYHNVNLTRDANGVLIILYPLLYPPAKKFERIWEYLREFLRCPFTYENQAESTWAQMSMFSPRSLRTRRSNSSGAASSTVLADL